ncbi:hypothetical protein MMC32_005499 [Xylographa parallela]|nr:hypothetical protein [Xylographa parallela]
MKRCPRGVEKAIRVFAKVDKDLARKIEEKLKHKLPPAIMTVVAFNSEIVISGIGHIIAGRLFFHWQL